MVQLYVLAVIEKNEMILLMRRGKVTFGTGMYSLPGGKVEENESATDAIVREVFEETGLQLERSDFSFVHTFHRKGKDESLIALCFRTIISSNEIPYNKEPEKCDDMRFFSIHELPDNILPAHKQAIQYILKNTHYSEHGW